MTKFNEDMIKNIEKLIQLGVSNIKACEAVGLCEFTFYNWMKTKPKFSKRIKAARSKGQARLLKFIHDAAEENKQWQAAAWILERTNFEEYGNKSKHELTGRDGGPIKTSNTNATITAEMTAQQAMQIFKQKVKDGK